MESASQVTSFDRRENVQGGGLGVTNHSMVARKIVALPPLFLDHTALDQCGIRLSIAAVSSAMKSRTPIKTRRLDSLQTETEASSAS